MEMDHVIEAGAAGIGLLRTEFMFMNRVAAPSEEEQYLRCAPWSSGLAGRASPSAHSTSAATRG